MYHLPSFIAELPMREGAYAIYIEPPTIAYVRVSNVYGDDKGVRATIDVIPTPGMANDVEGSFDIGSSWETFSNSYGHWHAIYVNWSLYFGAEKVKAGLELAAEAADQSSHVRLRDVRQALEKLSRP